MGGKETYACQSGSNNKQENGSRFNIHNVWIEEYFALFLGMLQSSQDRMQRNICEFEKSKKCHNIPPPLDFKWRTRANFIEKQQRFKV